VKTLYSLIAASTLILIAAACGSDSDSSDEGSRDIAASFSFEAFGNENFEVGQPISLDTFEGQPIVLNFWYPSCPPCRLEMPHFEAAFQTHKDEVAFVAIQQLGLDSADEGQEFIEEFGLTYAVGADTSGTVIKDYNVKTFPTTVFLDKDHTIVRKWAGPLNEEKLNELIEEILPAS
jgi:peroxiredoxin